MAELDVMQGSSKHADWPQQGLPLQSSSDRRMMQ
jgi:hypothetical protein